MARWAGYSVTQPSGQPPLGDLAVRELTDDLQAKVLQRWEQYSHDVESLLASPLYTLGEADPPEDPGVYLLLNGNTTITYVGKSTKSLHDRLLRKHLSGDESHAIQRALQKQFPDRFERRQYIRENVGAKWLVIDDPIRIADLERLLIWLFQPPWNRQ